MSGQGAAGPGMFATPPNPWRTLSSRIAYENAWIRVREDRVIRPDGRQGIYGVVEIRPSIGVVAIDDADRVLLAGQWRYTVNRWSWELPRGGSAGGETDILAVAQRELREETGFEAAKWESIGAVDLNNGVTTDVEHLFLATDLRFVGSAQEGDEAITIRWTPFADAVVMAMNGEITEVCSVAAILKLAQRRTRLA
ncbi:MAG TPA: NUDIX hydrolase [Bryobacteraceae bacterium]|nr:NUDIX hydrolase [Bryobacteraceae bacterium]